MTGSGTLLDPYVIWDVNDLQAVQNDLTAYYELGNDIDASATVGWNAGLGFAPIAPRPPAGVYFTGSFDGKGYVITNLFINRPAESYIGLFGTIEGASIANVGLVNCNIIGNDLIGGLVGWSRGSTFFNCYTSGAVTGDNRVGGLIGEASGPVASTIGQCHSTADIVGDDEVGGLVALIMGGTVSRCYATGNVTGSGYCGGLVGDGTSIIEKSYASGNVTSDSSYVGGLIGGSFGPISTCYARGSVFGNNDVGGLVGTNGFGGSIDNCYSTGAVAGNFAPVGGLVGRQAAGATAPTDSFWDTETSGMLVSDGGTGKTTAEMKTPATFIDAGWEFGTIWGMNGTVLAELVVYPDAHPEVTSVDGHVSQSDVTEQSTWAELVSGTGNSANSGSDYLVFFFALSSATTNRWRTLQRGILLFDTSAVPAGAAVVSATLSIYGYYKIDELSILPDVNVYSSAPASSIHLVIGDYDSLGSTPFCDTPITYNNFIIGDYNDFILNAAGLAAIVKGGITKLGLRNANYDVANVAPAWSTSHRAILSAYSADKGGIYRPKLTITYEVSCNDGYACLLDVTPSCAWAPVVRKGNIVIDQLIYQHAERMRR